MTNEAQHKFDEKSDRCVYCGLTEEQIEDKKVTICNGKLRNTLRSNENEVKKKYI